MRASVALAVILGFLLAPAAAGADAVPLAGVIVVYDPAHWRSTGTLFTCIAPDCDPRGPHAFASAEPLASAADEACTVSARELYRPEDGPRTVEAGGGIAFTTWSSWSGCRARDAPILEACAVHDGIRYRLISTLSQGCNRAPPMNEDRFAELLKGVAPANGEHK